MSDRIQKVWFVIPAAREAAFRALYATKGVRGRDSFGRVEAQDETIGSLFPNADGTKLFCGSHRCAPAKGAEIAAAAIPGLEVHDTWPPPGGWAWPK